MDTVNKNHGGLENEVQQNRGMDEKRRHISVEQNQIENVKTVDNGGAESENLDPGLEEQWLSVRDEYLANYPDLANIETDAEYESFSEFIDYLAKRRQCSAKEMQDEIMNWSSPAKE